MDGGEPVFVELLDLRRRLWSLSCSGGAGGDALIPHSLSHKGEEDPSLVTNGSVCPGRTPAPLLHLSGTPQEKNVIF